MTPTTPRDTALAAFAKAHGGMPTHLLQAPGRVNLIGEHTDYNDGFVLPCAIDRGTVVAARARSDREVRVIAADLQGATDTFSLDAPIVPRADAAWSNYVRGCIERLLAHGLPVRGMELALAGDVPQGAGLSSSASLEVAVIAACKALGALDGLTPTAMAQIAQQAENQFVGCACGIMDQLISARGVDGHALLIDCRSLDAEPVPVPDGLAILIVDSRVQRGLVDSAYNLRRRQCEAAARHFGVPALRDVTVADFARLADRPAADGSLLDPVARKRAWHIVTENQRVLDATAALRSNDLPQLGALMAQSHVSMRDDFEITVPPLDHLAALLQSVIGDAGGARMTGGGFGGCAVALLPTERVAAACEAVQTHYRAPSGEPARLHVCRASRGVGALA